MNKSSIAGAALAICIVNIASAQSGSAPLGVEMKREQATEPADTSGATAPGGPATSKHEMQSERMPKSDVKAMDTNKDSMISKEEFMAFHEGTYDSMQKNKDGMVAKDEFMISHEAMYDSMPKNKDGMVDIKNVRKIKKPDAAK